MEQEEQPSDEDHEEVDIVSTYFDGKKAVALRSDGTTASAWWLVGC